MLRTRVITALVLLAVLLSVSFSDSFLFFAVVAGAFLAAAAWESFRLFGNRHPLVGAVLWTIAFGLVIYRMDPSRATLLYALCAIIWAICLVPSLAMGLPPLKSLGSRVLNGIYGISILGAFVAIAALFARSPLYLLSVMAVVWVADIGAYFAGKAFGKHKLAPSISPGKSWEGAVGGWLAVLLFAAATVLTPQLNETFTAGVHAGWGWGGLVIAMTILVAASIVGDLFESMLKRRAGIKDSSRLLPGHGGVLDRVDSLIPVLPIAVLLESWLWGR